MSKVEITINTLKKKLNRSEAKTEKYKSYFSDVKEIALKYKNKYDEVLNKLDLMTKSSAFQELKGEGITTKDQTGGRNNLNTSMVTYIYFNFLY